MITTSPLRPVLDRFITRLVKIFDEHPVPTLCSRLDRPETSGRPQLFPIPKPEQATSETRGGDYHARQRATTHFRHSGWAHARVRINQAFHDTRQPVNRITAFDTCGMDSFVLRTNEKPYQYRLAGSACKDRFCQPCARDRARIITANGLDLLKGAPVRFITLTVRVTTESLSDALSKLDEGFKRLRRRHFWKHHVDGGVAFTEVKWIEGSRSWHPHLHVLTHGRYIPKDGLKRAWKEVTGDSENIDIRLVRKPESVLRYVTDYCGKGVDSSIWREGERLREAITTLKGRRFLVAFGDFRGSNLTDPGDGEAWENVGSLWGYLQLARDGDPDALDILEQIDSGATNLVVGWLRMRDPAPVLCAESPREVQGKLFAGLYRMN